MRVRTKDQDRLAVTRLRRQDIKSALAGAPDVRRMSPRGGLEGGVRSTPLPEPRVALCSEQAARERGTTPE